MQIIERQIENLKSSIQIELFQIMDNNTTFNNLYILYFTANVWRKLKFLSSKGEAKAEDISLKQYLEQK